MAATVRTHVQWWPWFGIAIIRCGCSGVVRKYHAYNHAHSNHAITPRIDGE